jgi:serine/threonine protein kinase
VETGLLIYERYRLQNLIQQGTSSSVYYGVDEVLSRAVAVKVVPAQAMAVYRSAIKMTANFSHPNIVGLYDLIIETNRLYVVQEYIEGEDFAALMQKSLTPFAVVDIGSQICEALLYAGSSSRGVMHGDLVPTAIMRDRNGFVRVNNFALPCELAYFQRWSNMGGDGPALAETELPWGVASDARRADDTRAVGLLLYQLLASRTPGSGAVEPRPDGRLSFQRNVPPELCETVARAVARQHPNPIKTPESLYAELRRLADAYEPSVPLAMPITSTQDEQAIALQRGVAAGGRLATALPTRDTDRGGLSIPSYSSGQSARLPVADVAPSSPTVADPAFKPAVARQAAYPEQRYRRQGQQGLQGRSSLLPILLVCLIVFVLLFLVGYFAGQFLIPH